MADGLPNDLVAECLRFHLGFSAIMFTGVSDLPESPFDNLYKEYSAVFRDFDDLTLARWLAQTLGQIRGRAWRLSHPLLGAYRLAAQVGHERQIWHKRIVTFPQEYLEAPCCGAPMLPLLTRDVLDAGLICFQCAETCVEPDAIPSEVLSTITNWAQQYSPVHAVAHWEDSQRKKGGHYERKLEQAASEAEQLLLFAGRSLAPNLLEHYPAVVWEDQDDCLDIRPEDVPL